MNFTITIAREYGSGGRFIASKVAEILNIPFYDKSLLKQDSKDSNTQNDGFDEDEASYYLPTMSTSPNVDMALSQSNYMQTLRAIQLIASSQSSVIVGRCADYILQDDPDSLLRVFIYAPLESKVKRAQKYLGAPRSKEETKKVIIKNDKRRKKYYEFITDKEWGNPLEYDLVINSDLGIDAAAYAIAEAAKKKFNIK